MMMALQHATVSMSLQEQTKQLLMVLYKNVLNTHQANTKLQQSERLQGHHSFQGQINNSTTVKHWQT